jgi:hypothetical protein
LWQNNLKALNHLAAIILRILSALAALRENFWLFLKHFNIGD